MSIQSLHLNQTLKYSIQQNRKGPLLHKLGLLGSKPAKNKNNITTWTVAVADWREGTSAVVHRRGAGSALRQSYADEEQGSVTGGWGGSAAGRQLDAVRR
jgi:hypothetical protein